MAVQDILLNLVDGDFDLEIKNGDFVVGPSDPQHVELILKTYLGNWEQFILLGVGIDLYQASSGMQGILKRNTTIQLDTDGYQTDGVTLQYDAYGNPVYFIDTRRVPLA
jgi:hypothetical protein